MSFCRCWRVFAVGCRHHSGAWEEAPATRFGASRCVSCPCASAQCSQTNTFHHLSSRCCGVASFVLDGWSATAKTTVQFPAPNTGGSMCQTGFNIVHSDLLKKNCLKPFKSDTGFYCKISITSIMQINNWWPEKHYYLLAKSNSVDNIWL